MNKKVPFKRKYDVAKKYDKYGSYLLWVSTILLVANFILSQYTGVSTSIVRWIEIANCLTIILFSVAEFVVDYAYFVAETHRREDLVDNSFASFIAENRADRYYTNDDLQSGLYKMGVNNFESCFFSYNIAKQDLSSLWIKSIVLSLIFVLVGIAGYDKILIFVIQLSIPVVLLQQAIKHTLFVARLKNVLSRYRSLFNSIKNNGNNNCDAEIIRDILEYETIISWGNILLNEQTYNKQNTLLSDEWKSIKERYSIK